MTVHPAKISSYHDYLAAEGKSNVSITEHIRYATRFVTFVCNRTLSKQLMEEYRKYIDIKYTTHNSKNNCISYVNSFLKFLGENELILAYFEPNRRNVKIKTAALTDGDIITLLHYAETCKEATYDD